MIDLDEQFYGVYMALWHMWDKTREYTGIFLSYCMSNSYASLLLLHFKPLV